MTISRLRIFVSSTFRDLKQERDAVRQIIDKMAHRLPVVWVGMEEFGSLAASPFEVSTAFAEKSDVVILIVADSYGSKAPDRGISFTETEFEVVLRDKIPCIAYLKAADEATLAPDVARFRCRINQELTSSTYTDLNDLIKKVQQDLGRELQNYKGDATLSGLDLEMAPFVDDKAFQGRAEVLDQLGSALASDGAHVGVWGTRGIGKTTFVQHFFSVKGKQYDPIWLRANDLFGRYVNGRLRIGAGRFTQEQLLHQLRKLLQERPRAVLVFDNVQSAPLPIGWLASRLGSSSAVFLSWDLRALPACQNTIHLRPLQDPESKQLLLYYCNEEQAYEVTELDALSAILEHHPLMLTLAGRQLSLMPGKTVADVVTELKRPGARLRLEGPTADASDETMRALLFSSYHCLNATDRQILSALSAVPARGISEELLRWLMQKLNAGPTSSLERAEQLGLMERRKVTDWRGHRYHLRSLIADFLKTTDSFPQGSTLVAEYLISESVFSDSSTDLVTAALQLQMENSTPNLPSGIWLLDLLVFGRPAIRACVGQLLASWYETRQLASLAEEIARLLDTVRSEKVTLELISLLERWRRPESIERLEKLWLRPTVLEKRERIESRDVRIAAGKALAAHIGLPLIEFLRCRLQDTDRRHIFAALDACYSEAAPEIAKDLIKLLDSPDPEIRSTAADTLSMYQNSITPAMSDRLFQLFQTDPDLDVRYNAAATLGVWAYRRILPYILSQLHDPDGDKRATACSILYYFRTPEVADALYQQALYDNEVKENVTFILTDFLDPRAGDLCLQFLNREQDERSQKVGASLAGMLEVKTLSRDVTRQITDVLADWLATKSVPIRLLARIGLLNLNDRRGYDGIWQDLARPVEASEDLYRAIALQQLAEWRPDDFVPVRLRPLLHDQSPDVRATAVLVAGQVRAHELTDELILLLEDETIGSIADKTVAIHSREALDRIAGKRGAWQPFRKTPIGSN